LQSRRRTAAHPSADGDGAGVGTGETNFDGGPAHASRRWADVGPPKYITGDHSNYLGFLSFFAPLCGRRGKEDCRLVALRD
jgi:hypothetical protein